MSPVHLPPIDILLITDENDIIGSLSYSFFDNQLDFYEYISEFQRKYESVYISFVYDTLNDEMKELCRTWEWEVCEIKDK